MSDDDLYDDLGDEKQLATATSLSASSRSVPATSTSLLKHPPTSTSIARPTSLVEEVQVLQQRVEALKTENRVLKRNMGTLYRTAVAEIQRKDAQIQELQLELTQASARDS